MHSLEVTHAHFKMQHKEPSFCFKTTPVGYKPRRFNLIQFWVSAVHCEGMLEAQKAVLWNPNSQSSSRFLFLSPRVSGLNLVETQWGMAGQCVDCVCMCEMSRNPLRGGKFSMLHFNFAARSLQALQIQLDLFVPCHPQVTENGYKYAREL